MPPKLQISQRDGRRMVKVNSTVVTLGIAGILAIAIGVYVNNRSWGPVVAEDKAQTASKNAPSSTMHRKQLVKLCRVEPRVEMSVREYEISYQGMK